MKRDYSVESSEVYMLCRKQLGEMEVELATSVNRHVAEHARRGAEARIFRRQYQLKSTKLRFENPNHSNA